VALYWALRGTDPSAIARAVRGVNPLLLLLSATFVTLTFPARAERQRWLLGAATSARPPWLPVWRATAIGFMANNVLPLRAGEVARGYATGRLVGMPVSTALSAIGVERVFDGIVLMLFLAIGIAAPGFPTGVRIGHAGLGSLAAASAGVFLAALVVLALVAHWPQRFLAPFRAAAHRLLRPPAAGWVIRVADGLVSGLSVLRRAPDFAWVLVWSLVVWLLNAASYVVAFHAFHLAVPVSTALVLQGILALGVSVPSSPGFVGVYEYFCRLTLGAYGVAGSAAAAFAIAVHAAWFVPITALGFWALARAGLSMHDIRASEERA